MVLIATSFFTSCEKEKTNFIITATAGDGGSISPSGSIDVTPGSDKVFTFTPNSGYQISDVVVDGASIGVVIGYTFTSVDKNHSISVKFESQENLIIGLWKWRPADYGYADIDFIFRKDGTMDLIYVEDSEGYIDVKYIVTGNKLIMTQGGENGLGYSECTIKELTTTRLILTDFVGREFEDNMVLTR